MRPMLYTKSFPPVLSNLAWYSNPVTDAAIEEGLSTVDPTKRAAAYAKAQAQVWKDAPWIYPRRGAQSGSLFEEAARRVHTAGSAVPPDRGCGAGLMRNYSHGRPTGRAKGPPEDRLRPATHVWTSWGKGVGGRAKPGHDSEKLACSTT